MGDKGDAGKANNPDDGAGDPGKKEPQLPEKLQGKSAEDIAQMYIDLEKKATTASQKAAELEKLTETLKPYEQQIIQLVQNGGQLPVENPKVPADAGDGGSSDEFFDKYGIEANAILGLVLPALKKEMGGQINQQVAPLIQKHQSEMDAALKDRYGEENFLRIKTQGANVLQNAGLTHEEAMDVVAKRLGIEPVKKKKTPPPDSPEKTIQPGDKGASDVSDEDATKTLMDRLVAAKPAHSILRPVGGSK